MTRDILDTNDPVLLCIDRKLRAGYMTAWAAYVSTCCTGGTPEQRAYAYEKARAMEDKLQAAIKVAGAEQKRGRQRTAQHQ